eukprot:CAMPEP_0205944170 /NCGR_PEP_ID=MMETSP1325-20131115/62431_1 /ASSEMBLY_ACC=CAM_ASM_000708 /TAXON_ID=236786 /ORGANISM="Florenciella sp., Strain RCC1007" /LENGTH=59 /DNA_ID=CAMNT_0053315041 /DNA_START=28 /DNA_END=207 /DNA_ORIENTATION=-
MSCELKPTTAGNPPSFDVALVDVALVTSHLPVTASVSLKYWPSVFAFCWPNIIPEVSLT